MLRNPPIDVPVLLSSFDDPEDDWVFDVPGLTNYMQELQLKELKIIPDAADFAGNFDYVTFEPISPKSSFEVYIPGGQIPTVPQYNSTTHVLYRDYHRANLTLLKLTAAKSAGCSRRIVMRLRKGDGTILKKRLVYLRFDLITIEKVDDKENSLIHQQSPRLRYDTLQSGILSEHFRAV